MLPSPAAADQRRRIIAAAAETAGVMRQAWESFGRQSADIRALAAGLQAPVWFAWSKNDRVLPLSLCRRAIARMREASVSLFGGGHLAALEQPEAFAAGFRRFVAPK